MPAGRSEEAVDTRLWSKFWGGGALVCALSLMFLRPSPAELLTLALVTSSTLAAMRIATSVASRGSTRVEICRVVVAFVGLGLAGWTTGLGPALGGFYLLGFIYVGLRLPARTTPKLVPLAAVCWLATNAPVTETVLARLPVAVGLWVIVGELLSKVTEERAADKALLCRKASEDALTGLLNRHDLDARLARLETGDAVVFVDLDHFKVINDRDGHAAGDHVLADLGRVITAVTRPGDVAIRYGGEEMLLLLPSTPAAGADRLVDRLRMGWAAAHPDVTFSAGVAVVDDEGSATAVTRADAALYRAKEEGRNRTVHAELVGI